MRCAAWPTSMRARPSSWSRTGGCSTWCGARRTARGLGLGGPRQSDIPNAGFNRVRLQGDAIDIVHWADTQHLADLPAQPVYDQTRLLRAEGVAGVAGVTRP